MTPREPSRPSGEPFEIDRGLLSTKFALPRVLPTYVARPGVDRLLDAGTRGPLTVVSAGPGWGKTLAVAAWAARRHPGRVAWVSLDDGDNEPLRFWSYVLASLRAVDAIPLANPLARVVPGLGDEVEFLDRLVAGMNQLDSDVVVVLDDFHLVRDPAVLSGVTALLRLPIDHLRLVVLTRFDPTLPLHRLRMNDDLTEIRARDLGFGLTEASVLMEQHAVQVTPDEAQLLVERTEGWPAGLRLAALFLSGQDSRQVADFTGDDKTVTGYLAEEVLRNQPPDMRWFLLRTSIAERLDSDLAERLTGEPRSQHHLETLEASNTFVVGLGPGRRWFRYHSLLREMLRHRLLVEAPDEVPRLHTLAARWYAASSRPVEALAHAADAGNWQLLARIFVTQAWPLMVSADRVAVARQLDRIPVARGDTPELVLCAAARLFHAGLFQDMGPHLRQAADRLDEVPPDLRPAVMLAQLAFAVVTSRATGDVPMLLDSASAMLELAASTGSVLPAAAAARAIALGNLGTGHLWAGRLSEARGYLEEGLAAAESARLEVAKVNALGHLGLVAEATGDIGSAIDDAATAIDLADARGWGSLPQVATAYLAMATVNLMRNNVEEAQVLLALGLTASSSERAPRMALGIAEVRLEAGLGRVEAARALLRTLRADAEGWSLPTLLSRWWGITEAEIELADGNPAAALTSIGATTDTEAPYVRERICVARALLMSGDDRGAEEVLAALRSVDGDSALPASERVELWLLTAFVADSLREDNRGVVAMRCGLEAAAPSRILRPFVQHDGDRMRRLLSRLKEVDPASVNLVDDVIDQLGATPDHPPPANVSTELTDRELMILRFLPTMMTNAEIAAELYLSVNTVKAHLKHIFRKLDVDTRRQAAHRAQELGLLEGTLRTTQR